jgi:hypothetical protein
MALRGVGLPERLTVAAAQPALGWATGAFLKAYLANRAEATTTVLEASPIAAHIRDLASGGWQGTFSQLWDDLAEAAPETDRKSRDWPKDATRLSGALLSIEPALRAEGIMVRSIRYTATPVKATLIVSRPKLTAASSWECFQLSFRHRSPTMLVPRPNSSTDIVAVHTHQAHLERSHPVYAGTSSLRRP